MLEAKIERAETLKKILDAIKELVTDANWDCSEEGMKLQAMDNSHIALVSLDLGLEVFMDGYRCDRNMSLGMNLASLQKILKCAGNDDEVTIRANEDSDSLNLLFQNRRYDRMGEYEMKLMDIDSEHLGIPDTQYDAQITMPSAEFLRIVRDIKELGESVKIEVTKEGVKFSSEGDIGTAAVTLKPTAASTRAKSEGNDDSDEEDEGEDEDDEDEDEADEDAMDEDNEDGSPKKSKKKKGPVVAGSDDEEEADVKPEVNGEDATSAIAIDDDDDDASPKTKKRPRSASAASEVKPKTKGKKAAAKKETKKPAAKAKANGKGKGKATTTKGGKGKAKKDKKDEEAREIKIVLSQSVALTFSIKYLLNFAKSTPLADYVHLHMSSEVPLLVEYEFGGGAIRYYLAPKVADE